MDFFEYSFKNSTLGPITFFKNESDSKRVNGDENLRERNLSNV